MRTTVTLDADVEALLKKAMRERGASFKQVLNEGLRAALGAPAQRPAPFAQMKFRLGRPLVDLTKATSLAEELEGNELASRQRQGR